MAGYQEEQYLKEKRLYLQADEKEREIRDVYAHRIRGIDLFSNSKSEEQKRWEGIRLENQCRQEVEFARLTILEPILDFSKKERLNQLREQKKKQKEEEERKRKEDEERRKKEEIARRKREEEERRLAPIRAKEAAEMEKKRKIELERQRKFEEERRKEVERRENTRTAIRWIVGIVIAIIIVVLVVNNWGSILAVIKWIFGIVFVIALISVFASN